MNVYPEILAKSEKNGIAVSLYQHLNDVAEIAIKIAKYLHLDADIVREGALLHDIGIVDVKTYYMDTDVDRLPADEKFDYRKHVFNGYEKVKLCDWMTERTKNIILGHHEISRLSSNIIDVHNSTLHFLVLLKFEIEFCTGPPVNYYYIRFN